MAFGNQMNAKWQGIDLHEVYADWAEAADGLSLGAINHGIELSKKNQHPPSQGEFIENCRLYKPALPTMIDCKITPEQLKANRKRIADIAKTLAGSKSE